MSKRTLNLVVVAGAVAVFVWIVTGLVAEGPASDRASLSAPASPPTATPAPSPAPAVPRQERPLRGYSLSLPEVDGLPSDLQPGDKMEIWVAWDPPLTEEPRIQRLLPRVIYERTIPPVLPGEPPTAVVLVPEDKVDELMYGDRYGTLSVSLLTR